MTQMKGRAALRPAARGNRAKFSLEVCSRPERSLVLCRRRILPGAAHVNARSNRTDTTRVTPPLPNWIRDFHCDRFTNIYELCPDETRLYGTESLYGNWDGEVLLLAQDFASRTVVERRITEGDPRPYRHEPKMMTNRNLMQLVDSMRCGKLYGSALAGLLRNSASNSGTLPPIDSIRPHLVRVLGFVREHMPNLRGVACLGRLAWELWAKAFGVDVGDWAEHLNQRKPVDAGGVLMFAQAHPARVWSQRGGKENAFEDWRRMAERLGLEYDSVRAAKG